MFNPKTAKLADLKSKDINKNILKKLAKVAKDEKSAVPFFCKHNFKFSDGVEGPLLAAGKIKKYKAEYKKLKTADEFSGLVYVQMSDKGIPTTVFMPAIGKLHTKDSILNKAMKAMFTSAWAGYKVGAEIDEKAAEAAEDAAEALADVEVSEDEATSEAAPTAETKEAPASADAPATAAAPKKGAEKLKSDVEALEALLEAMKGNQDAAKHSEMDAEFKKLVSGIKGDKKQ